VRGCRTRWDERLVKLVRSREDGRCYEGAEREQNAGDGERPTKSTPDKCRQDRVFRKVPEFPDRHMNFDNRRRRHCRIEPVQERNDKTGGMLGGKRVRGTNKDKNHPCNDRHPVTDDTMGLHVQMKVAILVYWMPITNAAPSAYRAIRGKMEGGTPATPGVCQSGSDRSRRSSTIHWVLAHSDTLCLSLGEDQGEGCPGDAI
jgi:hypothetical protein